MTYTRWFIPLCIAVSILFAVSILILTLYTLSFRSKVNKKYNRGNFND